MLTFASFSIVIWSTVTRDFCSMDYGSGEKEAAPARLQLNDGDKALLAKRHVVLKKIGFCFYFFLTAMKFHQYFLFLSSFFLLIKTEIDSTIFIELLNCYALLIYVSNFYQMI